MDRHVAGAGIDRLAAAVPPSVVPRHAADEQEGIEALAGVGQAGDRRRRHRQGGVVGGAALGKSSILPLAIQVPKASTGRCGPVLKVSHAVA